MLAHRDTATSSADDLTLERLNRSLAVTPSDSKLLGESVIPVVGIGWPSRIIRTV